MADVAYRVGVRTRAKMPYGSTASFCRIGRTKAIVLPDPVFALPMQSLPYDIVSVQSLWQKCGATRLPRAAVYKQPGSLSAP